MARDVLIILLALLPIAALLFVLGDVDEDKPTHPFQQKLPPD